MTGEMWSKTIYTLPALWWGNPEMYTIHELAESLGD